MHKSNKAFMLLSAFGIIFVLDSHCGAVLGFARLFPYDSFFMPMFVFISGYFFKSGGNTFQECFKFFKKKFKKLIIPFFGGVFVYGLLTFLLTKANVLQLENFHSFSLKILMRDCLYYGISFGWNDPAWFLPMLFIVGVFYKLLAIFFEKVWSKKLVTIIMVGICAGSIWVAHSFAITGFYTLLLKIAFFMPFYHFGYVYKNSLEEKYIRCGVLPSLIVCISLSILLQLIYGEENLSFPSCAFMRGFRADNIFLPLITSGIGIAFWLKIAYTLAPILGDSCMINFISENTMFLMTNHLAVKTLLYSFFYEMSKCGIHIFKMIDVSQLKQNAWYVYYGTFAENFTILALTLAFSCCLCYIWNGFKRVLKKYRLIVK